jgi:hypothetical protein
VRCWNRAKQIALHIVGSSETLGLAWEVSLKVFDMLGCKVTRLVGSEWKSAGKYTATFNAGNLSSGMYIYRLNAGNTMFTKKRTLIK